MDGRTIECDRNDQRDLTEATGSRLSTPSEVYFQLLHDSYYLQYTLAFQTLHSNFCPLLHSMTGTSLARSVQLSKAFIIGGRRLTYEYSSCIVVRLAAVARLIQTAGLHCSLNLTVYSIGHILELGQSSVRSHFPCSSDFFPPPIDFSGR